MDDRIAEVRKDSGLTQEEFAKRLGLSRNFVWMLENGERVPSDRTVSDICKEFTVNEAWLRTGNGALKRETSRDEEIAKFVGEALSGRDDDDVNNFKAQLIHVLSRLGEHEWEILADIAKKLYEEQKED